MNNDKHASSPPNGSGSTDISLEQMLDARERRAERQHVLLQRYSSPLICFTLNIPGPQKTFPLASMAFHEGCKRIESQLKESGIALSYRQTYEEATGYEAYYCVCADAITVKALMCSLEDRDSLGRILDIDVLRQDGSKLSRCDLKLPGRTCLLCGQPAPVCARSRAHSVDELMQKILSIITEYVNQRPKEQL